MLNILRLINRIFITLMCAKELSIEKGLEEEFELYEYVSNEASQIIAEKRRIYKGVSPNVDFYSGMIYNMLNIPYEMFTPIFAVARIAGWSAHRIEEIQNAGNPFLLHLLHQTNSKYNNNLMLK